MQSLLEVIQSRPVLISLWILIGSVLGGLLLLALLVFCLWKVSTAVVGSIIFLYPLCRHRNGGSQRLNQSFQIKQPLSGREGGIQDLGSNN